MTKVQILKCSAREILDSRGNPTVEATVALSDGSVGVASVPSGASTGIYEAVEKRDGDLTRYGGKGVLGAVCNICRIISPELVGVYATEQQEVDRIMRELDGTDIMEKLGANATLAVSLANARACANSYRIPLYRYLGGISANVLPVPMMNILNGGRHASNNVEIQEFMVVSTDAPSFADAVRMGSEIYSTLGKLLSSKGKSTSVGDEGGYAPNLESDEEALDFICEAIDDCGYSNDVKIALDVAASEWFCLDKGKYELKKRSREYDSDGIMCYLQNLCEKYPIISIEDGLDQRDFNGWKNLTDLMGEKIMLVGDDLFVTNPKRLAYGIDNGVGNAVLVKPNQIGTLTDVIEVMEMARTHGYTSIVSHRSGETEDTTIADIAVGLGAKFIKCGATCRSERVAKYNRLIRIESSLGKSAKYGLGTKRIQPTAKTFCGEAYE